MLPGKMVKRRNIVPQYAVKSMVTKRITLQENVKFQTFKNR